MNWIKKEIPEEPQEVIVHFENSAGEQVTAAYWNGMQFMNICEECGYESNFPEVLAWMPLPKMGAK